MVDLNRKKNIKICMRFDVAFGNNTILVLCS